MTAKTHYGKILKQIYDKHFKFAQYPEQVWHYTSAANFLKILASNELWLTHVSCLNDNNEVELAIEITRGALSRLENARARREEKRFAEVFNDAAERMIFKNNTYSQWYVASFSENEDDLNQWRAYAAGENGVAIGFEGKKLLELFASDENAGATLWKAVYSRSELDDFADKIAIHIYRNYFATKKHKAISKNPTEEIRSYLHDWSSYVDELSVIPKHPAFSSEKEWRLTAHAGDFAPSDMEFVPRNTTISRHIRVKPRLSTGQIQSLPINQVVIGPSRNSDVTSATLKLFLSSRELAGVEVVRSKIPFQLI